MLTPALPSRDERGKQWLQTQVHQLLVTGAVALAPPRFAGDSSCYWGTDLATRTTLYLRLAGDLEPKALRLRRTMIADCGAGLYCSQHTAILWIRRTLKKMASCPLSTLARGVHGHAHQP
jgi:hypothetical protein